MIGQLLAQPPHGGHAPNHEGRCGDPAIRRLMQRVLRCSGNSSGTLLQQRLLQWQKDRAHICTVFSKLVSTHVTADGMV